MFFPFRSKIAFGLLVSILFKMGLSAGVTVPTIPVEEIHRGMEGEWRTVVAGSKIESFPLRVLGTIENFVGPQRSIIIAEALDPENRLSGPVGGMSGSPVYFNGRLAGAYAYGFTFPKDQAIIGITPIADMIRVFDYPDLPEGRGGPLIPATTAELQRLWQHWTIPDQALQPIGGDAFWSTPLAHGLSQLPGPLLPAPSPLFATGLSPQTLEAFNPFWRQHGWELQSAPNATGSLEGDWDPTFPAGSAMAAVLVTGDISIAGVGTVTYNDGERFLAFGHPMLGIGSVDIPVAPAEILTVVRSVARSFKLSRSGPIGGAVTQDRLPAIAGRMDRTAPMIPFTVAMPGGDKVEIFQGSFLHHPMLTPNLQNLVIFNSLQNAIARENEQTLRINATLNFEGLPPLHYRNTAGRSADLGIIVRDLMAITSTFLGNDFEPTRMKSMALSIEAIPGNRQTELIGLTLGDARARAGADIEVTLHLIDRFGQPYSEELTVPLPIEAAGRNVRLSINDNNSLRALLGTPFSPGTRSISRVHEALQNLPRNDQINLRLDLQTSGLALGGQRLEDLPPSVRALLQNPRSIEPSQTLSQRLLWETFLPVEGTFIGNHSINFTVEP